MRLEKRDFLAATMVAALSLTSLAADDATGAGGGSPAAATFQRGDADGDGRLSISDAFVTLQVILGNLDARFACDDALDSNDDGAIDISDAMPILHWIFLDGDALAAPFLECGVDPTDDDGLGCEAASFACGGGSTSA